MSTTRVELSLVSGWVELADTADATVLIENQSNGAVLIAFNATAPAAGDPGHYLQPGAVMPRMAPGKIYGFSNKASTPVVVVVSK